MLIFKIRITSLKGDRFSWFRSLNGEVSGTLWVVYSFLTT